MTDFSDYPAKILTKVRSAPGKVQAAVHNAGVGVARALGTAGLEAHGASNAATRGAVNAAAEMAPMATAKAGAAAVLKAKPAGFNAAVIGTLERTHDAMAPKVAPLFNAVDTAERKIGDGLQRMTGERHPVDVVKKGVKGASDLAKSLTTRKAPAAMPSKPSAPTPPAAKPKEDVPMAAKGGSAKQASNGDVAPYKRYDPRAGRMVDVGGYNRHRND